MSIKWAIIGVDSSNVKVAQGLKTNVRNVLEVVLDKDRYNAFYYAKCCGAATYSDNVNEILKNDEIKSVYTAQIDPTNIEFILKCLKSGKSVVYERIFMRVNQLNELKSEIANSKSHITNSHSDISDVVYFV